MDRTAQISIAALVLVVVVIVGGGVAFALYSYNMLPKQIASPMAYVLMFLMGVICILNITFTAVFSEGGSDTTTKRALIWTCFTLLALVNIIMGVSVYNTIGDNLADNAQYTHIMLPASFLISVISTSIIIMQKFGTI
jgi:hypothetical protein